MHLMNFGVKKAGMTDANDEKLSTIMNNKNNANDKYFSKQKAKIQNQDEKIKQYLQKINKYKSNANLWNKT